MPVCPSASFDRNDPRRAGSPCVGSQQFQPSTFTGGFDRPVWHDPEVVKVLIVCDGLISYLRRVPGPDLSKSFDFAIGFMLDEAFDFHLGEHPSWARFVFTKAHRDEAEGTTPGFENFVFSAGSLDEYDELWLFGHLGISGSQQGLSTSEQHVIQAFMESGGGVLATGDHGDLGLALCGQIPRVRSMRTWWYKDPPPPPGLPEAPPIQGPGRNNTVVGLVGELDARPQRISPVYRYAHPSWDPWTNGAYAHPILCGPRGAITVMPDHIHEGACFDPDLSQFSGEYPSGLAPEIIAHGVSQEPAPFPGTPSGASLASSPNFSPLRTFGLLNVWDGHDPRVGGRHGRVVVDSTWHHWFNYNLFGLASVHGPEYLDILCYFRNVAIWLASPGRQARMRRSALMSAMLTPDMVELTSTLREYQPDRFYEIGAAAHKALGRIAPECQAATWWRDWLVAETEAALGRILYEPRRDHDLVDVMEAAAVDLVTKTMAGAMSNAVAIRINKAGFRALEKVVEEVDDAMAEGARHGRVAAAAALAQAQGKLAPLVEAAYTPQGEEGAPRAD